MFVTGTMCNAQQPIITQEMATSTINIASWAVSRFTAPLFDEHCIHDSDKNTFNVVFVDFGDQLNNIECVYVDETDIVMNLT